MKWPPKKIWGRGYQLLLTRTVRLLTKIHILLTFFFCNQENFFFYPPPNVEKKSGLFVFCEFVFFFTAEFSHFLSTNFWGENVFATKICDEKVTKLCNGKIQLQIWAAF